MAAISGKDGTAYHDGTMLPELTEWNATTTSANDAYASNATSGWKNRKGGTKDWTGSFACKSIPALSAGDEIAVVFYDNENIWTGNAIVDEEGVACDINDGTIVTHTVPISGRGELAKTTGSSP